MRQRRSETRKPLVTRQAAIEQQIASLAHEKQALDLWLASAAAYTDEAKPRLIDATERTGALTWSLARLEAEWLELGERLDALDAAGDAVGEQ